MFSIRKTITTALACGLALAMTVGGTDAMAALRDGGNRYVSNAQSAQAFSEQPILDMMDEFSLARYYLMTNEMKLKNIGDTICLSFDSYDPTKAAALCRSSTPDRVDFDHDEFGGTYIDTAALEASCRNMFGKKPNMNAFTKSWNGWNDAALYNGKPAVLWTNYEDERDLVVRNTSIHDGGNTCSVEQLIYLGYWGLKRVGLPNFKVDYLLEKNAASKYGYIMKSMTVERFDDEYNWTEQAADEAMQAPFYGIWGSASKDVYSVEQEAAAIRARGFDAKVYLTSDWSNLNAEPYYAVSIGTYDSEYAANAALEAVRRAGYTDTYVKYSGYRR